MGSYVHVFVKFHELSTTYSYQGVYSRPFCCIYENISLFYLTLSPPVYHVPRVPNDERMGPWLAFYSAHRRYSSSLCVKEYFRGSF